MSRVQQVVGAIVVIFVLYAVINDPQTSANAVRAIFGFLAQAVQHIFTFFDSLLKK